MPQVSLTQFIYVSLVIQTFAAMSRQGRQIAGVWNGQHCYCGSASEVRSGRRLPDAACNRKCYGPSGDKCGGAFAISLYDFEDPIQVVTQISVAQKVISAVLCWLRRLFLLVGSRCCAHFRSRPQRWLRHQAMLRQASPATHLPSQCPHLASPSSRVSPCPCPCKPLASSRARCGRQIDPGFASLDLVKADL